MNIPDRQPGSGDTRFTGTSTGQVQVGRFILDVPSPGGTTLLLAPRRARTEPPPELTQALARDTPAERDFVDRANKLLDTAEAVTDRVERVTNTVQALLEGRIPDADLISEDLMDSLALLQRLTQSGRLAEVIKLGRPLSRLFALTLRWAALVETLRLVFHAATALADTPTIGWTQHELGTLHGSVGNVDRARDLLKQARRTREAIGDEEGLRATDHNLTVLSHRGLIPKSTAALVGVGVVVLIAAVLVVAQTVGGGSSPGSAAVATTSSRTQSATATVSSSTTRHKISVRTSSTPTTSGSPSAVPRPSAVRFSATTIGQSESATVDLVNNGTAPLTATSAQIAQGRDATDFTVTSNGCNGQTVAAGASCTVTVEFTPTAAGDATASLTFSDNADPTTQQVELFGTGEAQAPPTTTPTTVTTTPTNPSSGQTATQPAPLQ